MSIFELLITIILIGFIFGIIFALIYRKFKDRNPTKQELVDEQELDKVDIPLDNLDLPAAAGAENDQRPSHVQYESSAKLKSDGSPSKLDESGLKVEEISVSLDAV
jgi:hypothetical protein